MHPFFLLIYFVLFADKPQSSSPALSETAIERRERFGIALDSLDLPVSAIYLDSLRHAGIAIHHSSRWMNGTTCEMDSATAEQVAQWSFVTGVECTRDNTPPSAPKRHQLIADTDAPAHLSTDEVATEAWSAAASSYRQLATYNLHPLHQAGFRGAGITVAVCDGAFYNADKLSCFDQSHLLGWHDFTDDSRLTQGTLTPEQDFFGTGGQHGTACLSAIAAISDDYSGAAPEVDYYLLRSEENNTESPKEMDNLVAAIEFADSVGADIFSVSLGYYYFDNQSWKIPKSALDGKTTRASRAALIAARKGMLFVVSAGNEGDKAWRTISVPADADSIITVGAVDTLRHIVGFSSRGPSADGRIKPDVCAVGSRTALISPSNGTVQHGNGTSFSTPLLAGMAACLWSALPDENAMQIRERIITSADRYATPDNDYGYGIPDAYRAYTGVASICTAAHTDDTQKLLRGNQIIIRRANRIYSILGILQQAE